ncbi:NAD-dependent epimerase/dehydratase family protein [Kutzneria sp. CA-103260]|uniref:NAD-dependent epimerase/dehydratase family protein n=1 Tax=Kutzneria sp. CA-103260 TaxID=2802641 RepID=UPI001BAC39DE|nr:NAD(P)-dependent oxidoreductase [Kutzneria sp. CA-103260]QUQ65190.1 NAD-dependent epimerase/dehydratase [Kutzneria sp. CA-103260]
MILITGGLGFIGSHTAQALLDLGESCVLAQRRPTAEPSDLGEVVQVDITDLDSLRAVGDRHKITGIVHLAGSMPWPPSQDDPIEASRRALGGLFNVLQVAQDWGVSRVGLASTIGVYAGVAGDAPLAEDLPLPLTAPHVIPAFKKIGELLADHLAGAAGLDIVNYRIGAIWGPLGHPADPFFAAPQLVHAAAAGTPFTAADGAIDLCYAKDCGRALALLQLSDRLQHRTYNVSAGRLTSNADVVAALRAIAPESQLSLTPNTDTPRPPLDITRLRTDTGYSPAYDTERAVADYLTWLRAGNLR